MARTPKTGFLLSSPRVLGTRDRRRTRQNPQWTTRVTLAEDGTRPRSEGSQGTEAITAGELFSRVEAVTTHEEALALAGNLVDEFFTGVKTRLSKISEEQETSQEAIAQSSEIMNRIYEAFKGVSLTERLPAQLLEQLVAAMPELEGLYKRPPDTSNALPGTTLQQAASNALNFRMSSKMSQPELLELINAEMAELMEVGSHAGPERPDFNLYTAVNLAGFSFEMYKMPKGGMVLYGSDNLEYHMTSPAAARRVFCGMIILTVVKLEHKHNPFIPVALRAVGYDHYVDNVQLNQLQAIYVRDEEQEILLELRVASPNRPILASATFSRKDLSNDNEMKTVTLTLKKVDSEGKASQDGEVYGKVTAEACYFDIQEVDDDTLEEVVADEQDEDDMEAYGDVPEVAARRVSASAIVKSLKVIQKKAEDESSAEEVSSAEDSGLKGLQTREWKKFASQVRDSAIGLHRMERLAYVLNPETDTRFCVWRAGKNLVLAFRGTETSSWKDMLTNSMLFQVPFEPGADHIDADAWNQKEWMVKRVGEESDTVTVHYGFLRAYASVREPALEALQLFAGDGAADYHLYVTGHSLGGALATIFAADVAAVYPDLKLTLYSFGAPKVGSPAFVEKFEALVPDTVRVVNNTDLVARIPRREWNFGHVGRLAVVREDGMLWVDDGSEENRLNLGWTAMGDMIQREMDTMQGIVMKSYLLLNDHLEDAYFSSLVNVQLKTLRGEDTTYA